MSQPAPKIVEKNVIAVSLICAQTLVQQMYVYRSLNCRLYFCENDFLHLFLMVNGRSE